jgi:hypothetical protein
MSTPRDDAATPVDEAPTPAGDALDRIAAALRGLRFGTVTAVIHDGEVVQVERTQRFRLERRVRRGEP